MTSNLVTINILRELGSILAFVKFKGQLALIWFISRCSPSPFTHPFPSFFNSLESALLLVFFVETATIQTRIQGLSICLLHFNQIFAATPNK